MTFALPHLDTDLSGKVELVTGAAGALGSRFAATLASCGAAVALADVRTEQLHRVQSELDAAGARCMAVRLDLTASDQLSDVVQQVESTLGAVDILVNNAGVNDAGRPHKMPPDLMSRVIATDLQGPFALSHRQHFVDGRVLVPRQDRITALLDYQSGRREDDRSAGRRMGPLSHQRQCHCAGPVLVGDDQRDGGAYR
jgi:NAD(P)-dependent dehydrogenase (short-subunit alcohol dehydrogenase family)